jgi:hypothetical protein
MYLWFALFRPQDWMWIDITSLRLSLVLGVVLVLPALATGLFPNITSPLSIGMILFLASCLVTQSVAVRPEIGWTWIDFLGRLFLAAMMMITLASTERRLAGVVAVISGSLAFHAAKAGLAFVLGGGTRFADGLAGAFVDNNGYALGTVMIIPMLVAVAQGVDVMYDGRWLPWIRRAVWAAVPLCVFAVIGTYSRGGFVSLSAAAVAFVLLQRRPGTAVLIMTATVSLALAVVPIPQQYLDRLQTIQTYEKVGEESALSRWHFWAVGVQMVEANPLGIGLRQYEQAYDRYDFPTKAAAIARCTTVMCRCSPSSGTPERSSGWALGVAFYTCFRAGRSRDGRWIEDPTLPVEHRERPDHLDARFMVDGSFLSLALNDITWLTFGMVGALGRLAAPPSGNP